jgi:predicted pyridoxine 5'-phosphate oxidase superfamily flavin-nucleotide-binding protein
MAVRITEEIKAFIEANKPCMVATANGKGEPNVSPKGSIAVVDEEHVAFADVRSPRTRQNLKENPRVCVLMVNAQEHKFYQLSGRAEYLTSGPLYDGMAAAIKSKMPTLPAVAGVVKIRVDEIRDFGSVPK